MVLPEEIIGLHRPDITIHWEDEHKSIYPARSLRLLCRCAFCIEEMTGHPLLDETKVPMNVVASQMELLGQYAVSVKWSDGHDTSIYRFRDLRQNCPCASCQAHRSQRNYV